MPRTAFHVAALFLLSLGIGALFLHEPGLGDDFTYWTRAFEIHDRGAQTWQASSFHDLRWPVWGVCWLWQGLTGPGLFSYYAEPWGYLAAGALLAFATARQLAGGSLRIAWTAGIAYLFHPLLGEVIYRPMPDLSEGIYGACAFLAWWKVMQSGDARVRWIFALLSGAAIALGYANRLTGVFIIPVLVVCTLLFFPRKFPWLLACGFFAALFIGIECLVYKKITGDFLHSLHANLTARGRKGTETIPVWSLPFRFLPPLWKGDHLAPLYFLLTLFGAWTAWRKLGLLGRATVTWLVVLYLEYSCGLQSIWPPRPLIREAERFLCALSVPMSALIAAGLGEAWRYLASWRAGERAAHWLARWPAATALACMIALAAGTSRHFASLGFVPAFRQHLEAVAPGTKIFTHPPMRAMCFLVHAEAARKFQWIDRPRILDFQRRLETEAAGADQFWYIRKLAWLSTRKGIEKQSNVAPKRLASYFDTPARDWTLERVIAKDETPDFVFYRRRTANDPPPREIAADAPEWNHAIAPLPLTWNAKGGEAGRNLFLLELPIAAALRGQCARLEVVGSANDPEAANATIRFGASRQAAQYVLKPYLHSVSSKDFIAMEIPKDAETCRVRINLSKRARRVTIEKLSLVLDGPAGP